MICNEGSGRNSREAVAIHRAMDVLGPRAELLRVSGNDLRRTAESAARSGARTVVAAGGDGTIMAVAAAVGGSGPRLGVLPLGTFNYFARGLGIPAEPEAAAEIILHGRPQSLSLGDVNGHLFLNNISLGVYPMILEEREQVYRRWGRRRLIAHWSVIRTFLRYQRPLRLTVEADGRTHNIRTPLLFAARSAFQLERFGLAGADCVKSGSFAVFVGPETTRPGLFRQAARLVTQSMQEGRDFDLICADALTIHAGRPWLTIACDGERLRMRSPLKLTMRRDVIEVLVPRDAG